MCYLFLKCICFCYRLLSCVIDCEHLLFWMMTIFSQYSSVHMRMHFATALQTSTLEAHANHNVSGTYRQHDFYSSVCNNEDRPAHNSSAPGVVSAVTVQPLECVTMAMETVFSNKTPAFVFTRGKTVSTWVFPTRGFFFS